MKIWVKIASWALVVGVATVGLFYFSVFMLVTK
jgi:hypothetical protein